MKDSEKKKAAREFARYWQGKGYEKGGYKYFYEVDEEELAEICEANGWEFYESGEFFAA